MNESLGEISKIPVVAYCRVSTNRQDQEMSFENQQIFFKERATKTESENLVRIYADKGISATSLKKRDEFKQMLYDAGINEYRGRDEFTYEVDHKRKPKFKKVYVRNTSRFTRDASIITILRALLKNGVHVHFLDIDLVYDDTSKEFMLNMFINFAQQESIDRSKKVRDGNEVMASVGSIRVGGYGIYGYEYSPITKKLSIIEEEAIVVRKIYELYLEGYGIRRILNYLQDNGIRPRGGKDRFSISSVRRILTNEKYYGCNVRNKYDSGSVFTKHYPKLKDKDEWIYHEGVIPVIIDKNTFLKAQEIGNSKVHRISQKGVYKGVSEFAGLITCKCGASYTRNVDKGRVFYNCSTKKSKGIHACDNINVSEDKLNEGINKLLETGVKAKFEKYKILMTQLLKDMVRSKIMDQIDKDNESEVKVIQEQVDKLTSQKNRLVELYLDGNMDKDFLDEKAASINIELDILNKKINELSKSNQQIYDELSEFDGMIDEIKQIQIGEVSSREELLQLIHIKIERDTENSKKPVAKIFFKYDEPIKKLASKYKVLEGISSVVLHT
ncbi:MAG: recombinase family protein [Bacillota bacterium]